MITDVCGVRVSNIAIIVGWIGGALSLFSIVLFSVCLGNIDELTKVIVENLNNTDISTDSVHNGILIVSSMYITIDVINLIASVLLIYGTVKERHLLLIPWLLNFGLLWLFNAFYIFFLCIVAISIGQAFSSISIYIISGSISLAFQYIIWYAIYSHFKQMQSGRDQHQHLLRRDGSLYPSYTHI